MDTYIVSPNVDGSGTSHDYLPLIKKYHKAIMGYPVDAPYDSKGSGRTFCNMKEGDLVIIAYGANDNKKYYFAGLVASESEELDCDGQKAAQARILAPFVSLEGVKVPFNTGCKYGASMANRFPAIYRLDSNNIHDQRVTDAVMKFIYVKEKVDSLLNSKNLILTGAPGTGKTYLAREIAREITKDKEDTPKDKRHWEFVQFHPSYDYTDFVEGLRPTPPDENNNIGFQGEDGIFKAFCKRAINNQTSNFEEAYKRLCNDLEENYSQENPLELKTKAQNKSFKVFLNSNGSLSLITGGSNDVQGSLTPGKMQTFLTPSPYKYWKSYFSAVLEYMKEKHDLKTEPVNPNQKYVFIIDEINRGDIAKIFGELFYAIDPDYRGKKGTIKTQYANLFQDDEVFANGMFYVPENVYIIGTMNDIDRNVECMDFAIRRRFTWVEIEPKDTISMWNDPEKGIPEYKDKAKTCMEAINKEITKTPGLGSAYQLGAAYFLKLKNYTGTPAERFGQLWKNHIEPLLKEYLRGMPEADATVNKMKQKWDDALQSETPTNAASPAATQAESEPQPGSSENQTSSEQQ